MDLNLVQGVDFLFLVEGVFKVNLVYIPPHGGSTSHVLVGRE